MKLDTKTWIMIAMGIAIIALAYIAFKPGPPPYDSAYTEKQIKRLRAENDSLSKEIIAIEDINTKSQETIDSLEKVKSKIIIKYVEKISEIDAADCNTLIDEFSVIFSDCDIK